VTQLVINELLEGDFVATSCPAIVAGAQEVVNALFGF
jgi:hypothetical protein